MPGRGETEQQPGQDRGAEREAQHPAIDGDVGGARNAIGAKRLDQRDSDRGQQETQDAAEGGEHQAFGEHLHYKPVASGAERRADGDLLLAHRRPHEQQVRDVRACDQDDDADRGEQREERRPDRANNLIVERHHFGGFVGARVRILAGQTLGNRLHLRVGLFERDARLSSGDHAEKMGAAGRIGGIERDRLPELRGARRKIEIGGHDARDRHGRAVQGDRATDDAVDRRQSDAARARG